ncbi:acyl-CoA N-acyltransferase [Aspergillus leporis]|jgi:ribosomal protein S18 acetylase RimI-like enzyme|uniref:Acyl-CoA N-acyltransferase n=1 Tax=Aspergillus leporis TaxID=41062 RepID=A0A5N5XHL4_9EURO|nr:acyl-CoA N-acyltransferase [Aspergillus leporis]
MDSTVTDILELPFTDTARSLHYRLSTDEDKAALRMIDSSFVTDRIFRVDFTTSNAITDTTGFGIRITTINLDSPLHKYFPDDEDSDAEGNPTNGFTVVVEDIGRHSGDDISTTGPTDRKVIGFVSAKFSAWNSRLIITDIEIDPSYRCQGIGRRLIRFAESLGISRYHVHHLWLEVSNVNYPAIQSYLGMGFQLAGLDVSLYIGTQAEREVALFMWKDLDTGR